MSTLKLSDAAVGQIRQARVADGVPRDPLFRNILVAVDGSELRSSEVKAALLVSGRGSKISALHVFNSPIDIVQPAEPPEEPCELSAEHDPVLDGACRLIPPELLGQRIYREDGDIGRELLDVARETGVDLLVVGTHGRGLAARMLLGSIAVHVLRHVPCPVLVVPRAADKAVWAQEERRILVAVDDDRGPSRAAADLAACLAQRPGDRIALVHVVQRAPEFVPEFGMAVEADLQPYLDRCGEAFLASFPISLSNQSAIHRIVREGEAADQILSAAAEWKADLIVMGTHGRRGIGRLLLGSTAEKVACHSACPVLCVDARSSSK